MNCPYCQQETRLTVKETRLRDGDVVRRRECAECGGHFGTRERVDSELQMGRREHKKPVRNAPKPANPLFKGVWK